VITDRLTDRIQSAMYGSKNSGFTALLQDCLMRINRQATELQEIQAYLKIIRHVPENRWYDLTKSLGAKVKRQKAEIRHKTAQLSMWQRTAHSNAQFHKDLSKRLATMDSHLGEIRRAALSGDLLRVVALTERWGGD